MKKLKWSSTKEAHAYMRMRKEENLVRCEASPAETWMAEKLKTTGRKWTRQAIWGFRLFDFWCARLGIAIEVDGPEHVGKAAYDAYRDRYNFMRSGILVIRVRNFNEADAAAALQQIATADDWIVRKQKMNITGKNRRRLIKEDIIKRSGQLSLILD